MNIIGILGCGWLGFPLAETLIKKGYVVKGTSTSSEKIKKLSRLGVKSYHYLFSPEKTSNSPFFKSIDTLVITIPFVKRGGPLININNSITSLVKIIENESIKKVIYLSSISVYDSQKGIVDESYDCNPNSNSGIETLKIENQLNNGNFITSHIRLGGLIGKDRHPIYSLSGKKFHKGNEVINLIHQDDAIGVILKVIKNLNKENLIFNAVTPFHPSKKKYYSKIADQKNILPPRFLKEKNIKRIVNSNRVIKLLNYDFKVNDLNV